MIFSRAVAIWGRGPQRRKYVSQRIFGLLHDVAQVELSV